MLICLFTFSITAYLISTNQILQLDTSIREWFYSIRGNGINEVVIAITHMGNWRTIVAIVAFLLLLKNTRYKIGVPLALSSTATLLIYKVLKMTFQRPRPDEIYRLITESGFSFPSGHSLNGIFVYGMFTFLINRNCEDKTVKVLANFTFTMLVIGIGLSRVFVGVHYPTDIIGGWTMGLAMLMVATIIYDEYMRKKN